MENLIRCSSRSSSCAKPMDEIELQRISLMEWLRVRAFLYDLTDPEKYGHALRDDEIRRRAQELLALFK